MFGWILFMIIFRVFLNFTRPIDYPTTFFDIIFLFVIYLISPLRIQVTIGRRSVFQQARCLLIISSNPGAIPLC